MTRKRNLKIVEKDSKPPSPLENEVTEKSKILEAAPETLEITPSPILESRENPEEATHLSNCVSKNVV